MHREAAYSGSSRASFEMAGQEAEVVRGRRRHAIAGEHVPMLSYSSAVRDFVTTIASRRRLVNKSVREGAEVEPEGN